MAWNPESPTRTDIRRIVQQAASTPFDLGEPLSVLERIVDAVSQYVESHHLPADEVAKLLVECRLDELRLFQQVTREIVDALTLCEGYDDPESVVLRILEHISERRGAIKQLAARRPD